MERIGTDLPISRITLPTLIVEEAREAYKHAIEVQRLKVADPEQVSIDDVVVAYCLGVGIEHISSWANLEKLPPGELDPRD
jgi:hypothetical protein